MLYNKTLIAFKCNKSVQTSNELVNCNKYFYSNKRPNRWWKQHDFFLCRWVFGCWHDGWSIRNPFQWQNITLEGNITICLIPNTIHRWTKCIKEKEAEKTLLKYKRVVMKE